MRKWFELNTEAIFKTTVLSAFILLTIYAVVFGCIILAETSLATACGNDILEEIYSLDNRYKVVVFRSDCGATTNIHTNASILRSSENITDLNRGNIFFADGILEIQVTWTNNRSIKITHPPTTPLTIDKMELSYGREFFEISYDTIHP